MARFLVYWKIDIEGDEVTTPKQAAEKALSIQRDPQSTATVFDVYPEGDEPVFVDLHNGTEEN